MPRRATKKESEDGYIRIPVPQEFIEDIDRLVESGKYKSRAEVVRAALRRFFERIEKEL